MARGKDLVLEVAEQEGWTTVLDDGPRWGGNWVRLMPPNGLELRRLTIYWTGERTITEARTYSSRDNGIYLPRRERDKTNRIIKYLRQNFHKE